MGKVALRGWFWPVNLGVALFAVDHSVGSAVGAGLITAQHSAWTEAVATFAGGRLGGLGPLPSPRSHQVVAIGTHSFDHTFE